MNLFAITALLSYRKKYYRISAIIAGIGTSAGPLMVFLSACLTLAYGYHSITKGKRLQDIVKSTAFSFISLSGILVFMLYQGIVFGTPFAFIDAQDAWGTVTLSHRLWNIITLYPIFGGGYGEFFRSLIFCQPTDKNPQVSVEDIFNTVSILIAIYSTFILFKARQFLYYIYSVFVISGYIWFLGSIQGTISTFRLLYVDVPIFIASGILFCKSQTRVTNYSILLFSTMALILQSAFFVSGYWAF